MGLFERFRKRRPAAPVRDPFDEPLIGSELFGDRPVSPREAVMPMRQKIQMQYTAEGRDPDTLERNKFLRRDEQFWTTYIDSLVVFERYTDALTYLNALTSEFPVNDSFREMRVLIMRRLQLFNEHN
jgi:hypothetical protein